MLWRHVDAQSERSQLVRDARHRLVTLTELCALYGISRVTGYKWLERAEHSGLDFLQELSRRPHSCPHATPAELQRRLLDARHRHARLRCVAGAVEDAQLTLAFVEIDPYDIHGGWPLEMCPVSKR